MEANEGEERRIKKVKKDNQLRVKKGYKNQKTRDRGIEE